MKQYIPHFNIPHVTQTEMQSYYEAMIAAKEERILLEIEMKMHIVIATFEAIRHTFPNGFHANNYLTCKAQRLAMWMQLQLNLRRNVYRFRIDPFHTWIILYATQKQLEITANMTDMPPNYLLATQLSDVLRRCCPQITPLIAKGWEMQKIA